MVGDFDFVLFYVGIIIEFVECNVLVNKVIELKL